MKEDREFDIIIAGAGASGLSLLYYLLQAGKTGNKLRVLLVDQKIDPHDDKTWCFWAADDIPFQNLISHSWNSLEVRFGNFTHQETLQTYKYHCIRSEDYIRSILNAAKSSAETEILQARISDFSSNSSQAVIHTSEGDYKAPWIFQSALKPPCFEKATVDNSLIQHFVGWEIESSRPIFDPGKATFMDFDTPQHHGITFFYALPFTPNRALVEYTLFSGSVIAENEYEKQIRHYLSERFGLRGDTDYRIVRKEKGAIPMEDRRYPVWYCPRVLNVGVAGGITKPSSGYAFSRIHRHSRQIVQALTCKKTPPPGSSVYRFRVYDMMLLYLMTHHPETALRVFEDFFRNISFDRIFEFLDEKTNLRQDLKILNSVPPLPFLKSIYKMKHRILTGA